MLTGKGSGLNCQRVPDVVLEVAAAELADEGQ